MVQALPAGGGRGRRPGLVGGRGGLGLARRDGRRGGLGRRGLGGLGRRGFGHRLGRFDDGGLDGRGRSRRGLGGRGLGLRGLAEGGLRTVRRPRPRWARWATSRISAAVITWTWPAGPAWMAAFNFAVVIAITFLVTTQLDPAVPNGYATWYVAASGVLLLITSTRRRRTWAWLGIGFLVVHTIVWARPLGVVSLGVIGGTSWVAVSHILSRALSRASRDAQRFALAERETTDWQAAQEAHLSERQFRLDQTSAMALDMLQVIERSGGDLTPEQRAECLHLEGAIRDEIRGRRLLNDSVRDEVMDARRRGATVTLLDEGGIDDLAEEDLDRVLHELASAIRGTDADRVIARTVPEGSDVAVTVVGLRSGDGAKRLLGHDSEEDDEEGVALWLEIPRTVNR